MTRWIVIIGVAVLINGCNPKEDGYQSFHVSDEVFRETVRNIKKNPKQEDYIDKADFIEAIGYGPDFEEVPVLVARTKGKRSQSVWLLQFGHQTTDLDVKFNDESIMLNTTSEFMTYDFIEKEFNNN